MNYKDRVNRTKKYFSWALEKGLLRFEQDDNWLSVEYYENLGYTYEDGYKWSLLCAQDVSEYKSVLELVNRINLMLTEALRSNRQDVNGLMKDN